MIISCPECAGPFELRDNDVAALVQLACPHCKFQMILDFAAANDASLVEAGMRMASGYRSAADYRRAASPEVHVAEVAEAPMEPTIERTPEVVRTPPTAVPVAPPTPARPPIQTPIQTPIAASAAVEEDEDDVSETIVRAPPVSPSATTVPIGPPGGGRSTVIGMVPPAARPPAPRAPADTDTEPARSRAEALAAAGVPVPIPDESDEPIGTPPPREPTRAEAPAARPQTPARTEAPARAPATSRPADDQPRTRPASGSARDVAATPARVPVPPPAAEIEPEEHPPSGMFGTIVLVILLLLAVGLTVASMLQKNTLDPRPLLEDLYRQYIKP